jgi:hypothetical protein
MRGGEPMKGRQEGIADASVLTDWKRLRRLGRSYKNGIIVDLKGTTARITVKKLRFAGV